MNSVLTQKIPKGTFSNYLNKKYMRNEFQMIINITDQDQEHRKKLKQLDAKLCRYKDIYPYEYNIIKINNSHEHVNASMMNVITEGSFIASQGPNDNTVDDFWQMFSV